MTLKHTLNCKEIDKNELKLCEKQNYKLSEVNTLSHYSIK